MLTDHGCLGPAAIVVAIGQGRVQTELLAHMELPAPLRPLLVPLHPIPHVTPGWRSVQHTAHRR
jgi:hypothetical protein